MFGLAWIFLILLCSIVISFLNRLKGKNDMSVSDDDDDQEVVNKSLMGFESDVVVQSELISKYQFIPGKDVVRGFLEHPETKSFTVEELFVYLDKSLRFDQCDQLIQRNNLEERVTAFDDESYYSPVEDEDALAGDQEEDAYYEKESKIFISVAGVNDQERAEETVCVAEVDHEKTEENISVAEVDDQEKTEENIMVAEVNDREKTEENKVAEVNDREKPEENISVAEVNDQEKTDENIFVAEIDFQEKTEENIYVAKVNDGEKAEENISVDHEKTEKTISVAEVNDREKTEENIFAAEVNDEEETEEYISVAEVNSSEVNSEDSAKILCNEQNLRPKEGETEDEEETQESEDFCFQNQLLQENKHESADDDDKDFLVLNISKKREVSEPVHSPIESRNVTEMSFGDEINRTEAQEQNQSFWDSDSDEDDEFDVLLEHQNLVHQIKMEMRNSRIRCLPTISEECETPKMSEDLKPLKIDEKLEYKDRIEEIQKFYKCYAEKMRKLDVLNYQTLNAISLLQLKDTETFTSGKRSLLSSSKKLLPLRGNKLRRIYVDQTHKSISELSHNLELVYVGQACLSWEILCWQYGKTKELFEYDAKGHHTYNHVAGEFMQFQVLLQRFVEDQPFQGHRLQFYAKNRCVLRSFLQVPTLKDDCLKEKKMGNEEETEIISLVKLSEIINKTMHVFWEFIHADKDESSSAQALDPELSGLLMDVTVTLMKKERKIKEIQRSGNCIVKKFQKQQEGRTNQAIFLARVELRLVAKVLGLPKLNRDQLVWCQKKLDNINIVGRKVSVEPSCLLFPC